ncbi:MAG: hypothetical protein BM485_06115 [Desulfobulbaceae bacterium DB1]|nr:MAG: hypothetical protein BM485_06115 [Desulfobulbaceae bacterium DB1]
MDLPRSRSATRRLFLLFPPRRLLPFRPGKRIFFPNGLFYSPGIIAQINQVIMKRVNFFPAASFSLPENRA